MVGENVQKLDKKDITSPKVMSILNLDSINVSDIIKLRQYLLSIKSNKIQILESYDERKGRNIKFFDITYEENIPYIRFYYRIFDSNFDFTASSLYTMSTQNGSTGGILDKKVIWYYR